MQMVIDGLEFAGRGNKVSGSIAIAELSRVVDYLVSVEGALDCEVQGERSEDGGGHLELELTVTGTMQLRCQRCLQALALPLQVHKRLRLVVAGKEWPEEDVEDEGFDAIEASREMVVGELIEDEVLLALPISPRHEVCDTPVIKDTKQDASPFAVLRKLKID